MFLSELLFFWFLLYCLHLRYFCIEFVNNKKISNLRSKLNYLDLLTIQTTPGSNSCWSLKLDSVWRYHTIAGSRLWIVPENQLKWNVNWNAMWVFIKFHHITFQEQTTTSASLQGLTYRCLTLHIQSNSGNKYSRDHSKIDKHIFSRVLLHLIYLLIFTRLLLKKKNDNKK